MEKSQRELEASTQNLKASISSPAYAERTKPEIQAQHKAKVRLRVCDPVRALVSC